MFKMRKRDCWSLGLIVLLVVASGGLVSAVRINEVMYRPTFDPNYNEYIEIYNNESESINLTGWKLCNNYILSGYIDYTSKEIRLNTTLILETNSYAIITDGGSESGTDVYENFNVSENATALHINLASLCGNGLIDSGEEIILSNGTTIIHNLTYDPSLGADGDNNSLQFYNNSWQACAPTPGFENNCSIAHEDEDPEEEEEEEPTISIGLDWVDDQIVSNGDEFEIELEFYNLADGGDYEVKVWIELEGNETTISDRYDEEEEEWKSGNYWVYNFIAGGGNKTKDITLKIRDNYKDYSGEEIIFFKIRNDTIEIEIEDDIDILEGEDEEDEEEETATPITGAVVAVDDDDSEIIQLNDAKDIKSEGNSVGTEMYKSKTQYIKEYSIYGFAIFCVAFIVLLIKNKF